MSKYDLSSITHATIAGEPLNPEVFNQFYKATGLKLMEGFGQTETTLTLFNPVGTEPKPGSMGKPSPAYHVDLIDDEAIPWSWHRRRDRAADRGWKALRYVRRVLRNPELTKTVWDNDIYHTGDTAWRDEDGYFWYVGRTDDIIKSSGYRIGPFEIESVVMELPYVLECAITGTPDLSVDRWLRPLLCWQRATSLLRS